MLLSAVNVEKKVRTERRKWPIAIANSLICLRIFGQLKRITNFKKRKKNKECIA